MAKKQGHVIGKSNLVRKMAKEQGESVAEILVATPAVPISLPQPIEGVKTQVFADACKVILADEIKAAEIAINTLKDKRESIGEAYTKKAKALVAVWVRAIRKDLKEVLVKHSVDTADESDNRCYGTGRVVAALESKSFLEELCPFKPETSSGRLIIRVEGSVLPEELRGDRQKYLECLKELKEAEAFQDSLRARAKDLDTEVARYRLSESEGMTPDQYEKVKAMLLRKD